MKNRHETQRGHIVNAPGHTILIVDDAPANLSVLTNYLASSGFHIQIARTGETGVDIARRALPDLILLDVLLPGIDGFEVCRRLKADDRTQAIPVIFITIVTGTEDKVKGFQAGGLDYIAKPFQREEVLARITTHLTLSRLQQELQELNRSLEQQVAARTAELRAANAQLQIDLAERKRAEEALRDSEERLRLTMEAANIGSWDWDVQHNIWSASPIYYTMLGYKPKAGPGDLDEWLERVHPDDRAYVAGKIQGVLTHDFQEYQYEARFRHADGTYRWQYVRGFSVKRDQEGKVTRILGIRMDITERKQAEQGCLAHLRFFERLDQVNRAIQGTNDFEQMMRDVLDATLSIFECDRAFLLYPCDPDAPTWFVPMERNKPEYPGVLALGLEMPMDPDVAETLRILLNADGPVQFGPGTEHSLPTDVSGRFDFKNFLSMALYPKVGSPWQFGIHQCSSPHIWTPEEERLFQEIGRRLGDALTSLLTYRDLQESEAFLNNLVENIPDMIFVKDADTLQFVRFNKAGEQLLGYSREELLGKTAYDFFPREEADFFTARDREALSQKELIDVPEEIIRTRSNDERILHTKKIPILDEHGAPQYLLGISEDITERKHMEEELKASEEKFRVLFEYSPISIWEEDFSQVKAIFDDLKTQGVEDLAMYLAQHPEVVRQCAEAVRITDVNRATLVLHEATIKHELSQELTRTFTPESYTTFTRELVGIWQGNTEMVNEAVVRTLSGTLRHVIIHFAVCPGYENTLAKVLVSVDDITERKQAEEKLKESEERLRLTLEAARIGIWDWDIHHDRWYASPSYYTMLGYEPKAGPADRSEWLERLHPDDRAAVFDKIHAVLTGDLQEYRYEARMRHANGAYRWVSVVGFVIQHDQDGQATRMLGIRMDITDRKQAEQEIATYRKHLEKLVAERTAALEQEILERKHVGHELQQAKDAAEAANRAKSAFLANMSHELRTPLNAILGFAQLLWRDPQSTQREALNIILRSGEHLLTLINGVLEIARIEAGRIELHPEVCDVSTLIHDVIDMMRNPADAKQLSLTLTPSSDIPRYIQADTSKLRQILVNLIDNAIKFTETGGVTVRVRSLHVNEFPTPAPSQEGRSSAEARPTRLHVEIADTGIGIAAADQDLIFKPFEQIGMLNTTTGSGLGLTITRQYLELMGGSITVESPSPQTAGARGGPGSVFRFELPVQPVSVEAITRTRAGGGYVMGLEPGQPVYRILIVEDQFEIRVLLRKILEPVGFEVREAVNGAEAIQLFQAWQPQVIFMDRRIPGMDGLEATRHIKALDHGSNSVIIMLTASAFKEQRDEALAAGSDDFLRKPFREAEIFEILRQHLGVRYVYEEGEGQKAKGEGQKIEEELTPEALAMLPPDLLSTLEQAALQLDLEKMDQVIAAIRPEHHDVAERLAALAQDFHCKEIWTIIQQTRQQERPHE